MRSRLVLVACVLGSAAALFGACSNQGEGERCDVRGDNLGNDECQSGLRCTPQSELNASSDLCCPPDRSQATTQACALATPPVGGDSSIPLEAGGEDASDSSAADAPEDSADAESDADASSDSATDGDA